MLGNIYATNITPDDATGIGQYSFDEFDRVAAAEPGTHVGIPNGRILPGDGGLNVGHDWHLVEVEIVGRLAVNVNRYLDRCHAAFYGHRLVVGSSLSTPMQEGPSDSPDKTGDDRFTAFSEWTFAL